MFELFYECKGVRLISVNHIYNLNATKLCDMNQSKFYSTFIYTGQSH